MTNSSHLLVPWILVTNLARLFTTVNPSHCKCNVRNIDDYSIVAEPEKLVILYKTKLFIHKGSR